MKKQLFLTVVLYLMLQVTIFGQSIKLNNEGDPGSAMLEVNSASKGILIPNVALTGITDATTITSPAASLLVYNTATVSDVEPGYYYNSGTAVLPVWSRLSTGTNSQIGTNTTNYLSKWNGTALVSSSVFDDGTNVGIGTSSPSFPIDVQGTGGESIRAYTTDTYYAGYLSKNSTREFFAGVQADFETNDAISGYHIYDNTAGVRRFVIDKDGDVGIGESNPNAKLHVNGNVKVAGIISGVIYPVDSQDAATKAYVDASTSSPTTYTIGLSAEQGGYIFWVSTDGKHGLVAETIDQSNSSSWYEAHNVISNPSNHSADGDDFRDWRMPTKYELNEMYLQKVAIGRFSSVSSGSYWSSTEFDDLFAWIQNFTNGFQYYDYKYYSVTFNVRAVRAF
jgi:hypothetical protein